MPSLTPYLVAGALVVLTMDAVAPPIGSGTSLGWPSVVDNGSQLVNRSGKADRLPIPVATRRASYLSQHILVGCEPAFSPLSAAAQLNFPGRCVA
jgi:hypothetical protein